MAPGITVSINSLIKSNIKFVCRRVVVFARVGRPGKNLWAVLQHGCEIIKPVDRKGHKLLLATGKKWTKNENQLVLDNLHSIWIDYTAVYHCLGHYFTTFALRPFIFDFKTIWEFLASSVIRVKVITKPYVLHCSQNYLNTFSNTIFVF